MSQILTYEQIDRAAWAQLVRESETGTWFQSPEAYAFYASLPDVMEPFVYGLINDRSPMTNDQLPLRALCVGYVTKERNPLKQFFTRRAIINGGVCLANDATNNEVETLLAYLRSNLSGKAIYLETRNFNDYSRWKVAFENAGFVYKPHLDFHVRTDGFEARLSDNRKRQIKKAESIKEKLERYQAQSEWDVQEWYGVLSELYRTKVKTPLFPIEFFSEAYRQGVAKFLLVRYEGKIIGGSMVVADDKCVYEWFECGLNTRYKDQYPSVIATVSGIEYARRQGRARYDMMGAGEPDVPYGVRDFKAEFGGQLVEYGRFLCVCRPCLYRLGAFVVRLLKRGA